MQPFNLSLPGNNRKTTENVLELYKEKAQEFSSETGSEGSQNGWEQIDLIGSLALFLRPQLWSVCVHSWQSPPCWDMVNGWLAEPVIGLTEWKKNSTQRLMKSWLFPVRKPHECWIISQDDNLLHFREPYLSALLPLFLGIEAHDNCTWKLPYIKKREELP